MLYRKPQRRLAAERGSHQIEPIETERVGGLDDRCRQFRHRAGAGVLRGLPEPRHLDRDDAVRVGQQIMRGD